MEKLLFLDDEEYRHRYPYDNKYTTVSAWNIGQFINALYHWGPFDYFSLDHDLAENHYRNGHGACGCEAAKIITMLADKPKLVIVHSFNKISGPEMVKLLEEKGVPAIWKPFHPKNTMTKQLDIALLLK